MNAAYSVSAYLHFWQPWSRPVIYLLARLNPNPSVWDDLDGYFLVGVGALTALLGGCWRSGNMISNVCWPIPRSGIGAVDHADWNQHQITAAGNSCCISHWPTPLIPRRAVMAVARSIIPPAPDLRKLGGLFAISR